MSSLDRIGNKTQQRAVRLHEEVQTLDLREYSNQFMRLRIIGPIVPYRQFWVPFKTKTGKEISFPKDLPGCNPYTGEIEVEGPYYKWAQETETRISQRFLMNVIVRDMEEDGGYPGRLRESEETPRQFDSEWGMGEQEFLFKDNDNRASRTPVRVLDLPLSVILEIKNLQQLNKRKNKAGATKTFPVDHHRFGADINLKYDKDAKGPARYSVSIAGESALREEDYGFHIFDITNLRSRDKDDEEEQKSNVVRWTKNQSSNAQEDYDATRHVASRPSEAKNDGFTPQPEDSDDDAW